ncbi:hypothetical protein QUF61_16455 [Candidatus Venteria ishoeyi]|uniref:hypothetical protein n=1 Tax=Candidatus Venteria ishoeyi TaxID=1899563 RepID=UPI0025A5FB02|nr:hypothetical protein [Candidatus Venteria ishoeyi]MDM8548081.1 hypothetical protein [Candidatus Venteria ishoeyi]
MSLVLHAPADFLPTNEFQPQLQQTLQALNLLGEAAHYQGREIFYPGTAFDRLLTFLGCAPCIETQMPEVGQSDTNFYYLELFCDTTQLHFLGGEKVRDPHCQHCRSAVAANALLQQWSISQETGIYTCPNCQQAYRPWTLNWRKCAGFSRAALIVHGVFEGEARPSDALLDSLNTVSAQRWKYFYQLSQ